VVKRMIDRACGRVGRIGPRARGGGGEATLGVRAREKIATDAKLEVVAADDRLQVRHQMMSTRRERPRNERDFSPELGP
jgi:hypothetical protein